MSATRTRSNPRCRSPRICASGRAISGRPSDDAAKPLAAVGLEALAALPAAYLSAGQRRRLSLARLIAAKRPIWLLDEPTSALDAAAQSRLTDMMRGHLASGGLIVAATHGPLGLDKTLELRLDQAAPSPVAADASA